jgi:nucleoside 2-deoxyribosyltransferase
MNKKKLYLSHNMEIRHKVRVWELIVESNTNIELVNPFYDLNKEAFESIENGIITVDEFRSSMPKGKIVENDLNAIKSCDGIVSYIEKPSFGTAMELFYCKTILNKPIYIYTKNHKFAYHPWITYCSDNIFTSLEELYNKLEEL